jgi:hypothetical protein
MKISPESDRNLENFIARTLRDQPMRRAPRSLEQRVLAELARRAARPWWRQDFAHWPVAMRGVFLAASAALAAALVWALAGLDTARAVNSLAADFAWVAAARDAAAGCVNFGAIVLRGISPIWLYGGAATIVGLYAALFGLGTAAYRTLYANR